MNYISIEKSQSLDSLVEGSLRNIKKVISITSCDGKKMVWKYGIKPANQTLPSDFLSAISHELKTPISAILALSEILKDEANGFVDSCSKEERADIIKDINLAALELNELVHDLLDVGQIASGNFSVDVSKEIDLADVVKRSVKLNYDYALRRNIAIKTEVSAEIKPIKLDAKRMKQILTNLISNAIKYSPANTEVKIICESDEKYLNISVIDQGFGMTLDQLQTAFTKYKTIPNPNSNQVDSFGFGLPITKQLVELQNGEIEVRSEIEKGTEIKIKFPYSM